MSNEKTPGNLPGQSSFDFTPETPRARRSDPATSHMAAASVGGIRKSLHAVFECLRLYGPMTDEELVGTYDRHYVEHDWPQQSLSGIRSRRKELTRLDPPLAHDTQQKRTLASGRKAIVWSAL